MPVQLASRDLEIARKFGAAGEHDQRHSLRAATASTGSHPTSTPVRKIDALGLHLAHAPVDQMLLHLEVGDAVAQQPADPVVLLEQGHRVAGARELLGAGEARRAGADDGDALARLAGGHCGWIQPSCPAAIDDRAFDRLDGHRIVVDVQRARGLAGRGADAAGELREVVGRLQDLSASFQRSRRPAR
jgi:hypothetical protein